MQADSEKKKFSNRQGFFPPLSSVPAGAADQESLFSSQGDESQDEETIAVYDPRNLIKFDECLLRGSDTPSLKQRAIHFLSSSDSRDLENAVDAKESLATIRIDSHGNKLLHFAALIGNESSISYLCQNAGAGADDCNDLGFTPLHVAAYAGRIDNLKALFFQGASIQRVSVACSFLQGENEQLTTIKLTPLHLAILRGHKEVIEFLLSKGLHELDKEVTNLGTILHLSLFVRQPKILSEILKHSSVEDASLYNNFDSFGRTPLMLAADLGEADLIDVLCDPAMAEKIKKNSTNNIGWNALHFAVRSENRKAVIRLIAWGVNTNCRSYHSTKYALEDPLGLAQRRGHKGIQNIIVTHEKIKRLTQYNPDYRSQEIHNLALQGGGPKGIAYVGAIRELEKLGKLKNLRRVAGTSAGAITAALLAIGIDHESLESLLNQVELTKFLEGADLSWAKNENNNSWQAGVQAIIEGAKAAYRQSSSSMLSCFSWLQRLSSIEGLSKGDFFREWLDNTIKDQLKKAKAPRKVCENFTFGDLKELVDRGNGQYRHLYVVAIEVTEENCDIVVMNSEDKTWRNVIIADAVRASMSIPVVFSPHTLQRKNELEEREPCFPNRKYIDGGLLWNFPVRIFDFIRYKDPHAPQPNFPVFNKLTLGLSLVDPRKENSPHAGHGSRPAAPGIQSLLSKIAKMYYNAEDALSKVTGYDTDRTIFIDNCGVETLSFDLSTEQKNSLIKSGGDAVASFFPSPRPNSSPRNGFGEAARGASAQNTQNTSRRIQESASAEDGENSAPGQAASGGAAFYPK